MGQNVGWRLFNANYHNIIDALESAPESAFVGQRAAGLNVTNAIMQSLAVCQRSPRPNAKQ